MKWVIGLLSTALVAATIFLGWDKIEDARMRSENARLAAELHSVAADNKELTAKNDKLQVALKLLRFEERRAYLRVLSVDSDSGGEDKPLSTVAWVEVDKAGKPIGKTQKRQIIGKYGSVHARVISFDDDFIMEEDPIKGRALVVFDKICGSSQAVDDVKPLEFCSPYNSVQTTSEFERQIWSKFETLATNSAEAKMSGVRYAQATSAGKPMTAGATYRLLVRSTGEIYIVPLSEEEAAKVEFPEEPGPSA